MSSRRLVFLRTSGAKAGVSRCVDCVEGEACECQECGRFFQSRANLNCHMETHRTRVTRQICRECGREFMFNNFQQAFAHATTVQQLAFAHADASSAQRQMLRLRRAKIPKWHQRRTVVEFHLQSHGMCMRSHIGVCFYRHMHSGDSIEHCSLKATCKFVA